MSKGNGSQDKEDSWVDKDVGDQQKDLDGNVENEGGEREELGSLEEAPSAEPQDIPTDRELVPIKEVEICNRADGTPRESPGQVGSDGLGTSIGSQRMVNSVSQLGKMDTSTGIWSGKLHEMVRAIQLELDNPGSAVRLLNQEIARRTALGMTSPKVESDSSQSRRLGDMVDSEGWTQVYSKNKGMDKAALMNLVVSWPVTRLQSPLKVLYWNYRGMSNVEKRSTLL